MFLAFSLVAGVSSEAAHPDRPCLTGNWWRLATPPTLERFHKPGIQTVDFTVFQAADGTWQLISCLRKTACPGGGRLLYRWEGANLTDSDWTPKGIFRLADPELGQTEGKIQAPHCIKLDGRYYLFYNSNGAYCMISDDGKTFRHHRTQDGDLRFFDMPRDVMVFDNRARDGLWYAYFTDILPGKYPAQKDHTVGARTARVLEGPWSRRKLDIGVISAPPQGYLFAYAESPFVLYRKGWYYRLEQMNVLASKSPTQWQGPALCTLGDDPMRTLAPEIVEHEGTLYVAGYRDWGNSGIFMSRLKWLPTGE
jgi:hypothetical protein